MGVLLGAIADDFTGATDLCNTLVRRGMRTVQLIGVPAAGCADRRRRGGRRRAEEPHHPGRRGGREEPRRARLAAPGRGAADPVQILLDLRIRPMTAISARSPKRCSTRSAPISPLFCPAFPETGRTIYRGYLFVGDVLLSESGMRDHPLTPMRDPDPRARAAAPDAAARSGSCRTPTSRGAPRRSAPPSRAAQARVSGTPSSMRSRDHDLEAIGEAAADLPLITGGSGIALGPAGEFPPPGPARRQRRRRSLPPVDGRGGGAVRLVLGSDARPGRLYARARAGLHDRPDRGGGGRATSPRRRSTGRRRGSASGRS